MRSYIRSAPVVFSLALLLCISVAATAQSYRNLSSVHDGSGVMSTNTVLLNGVNYNHVSAAGQPGGIFTSSNGSLTHYAGFLQAVDIKRPNQKDIYGNPYELTQDNDADGLQDLAEIQGTNFNPATPTEVNIADTDDDGSPDGAEAIAETDPTDESISLEILNIRNVGGNREMTYLARANKTYHIRGNDGSYSYPKTDLGPDSEAGGVGVWFVRTNTYTDAGVTNARSYAIEAQK